MLEAQPTDSAVVIGNPVTPGGPARSRAAPRASSTQRLRAAADQRIRGKAITPFLLDYFRAQTGGASVEVNLKLVRANARLATQIAANL